VRNRGVIFGFSQVIYCDEGLGLDNNSLDAYRFLCLNYETGRQNLPAWFQPGGAACAATYRPENIDALF
jgi:uncharacterized protein (DUF2235 family)